VGSAAPPETCSRPLLSFTYEQIRVCPGRFECSPRTSEKCHRIEITRRLRRTLGCPPECRRYKSHANAVAESLRPLPRHSARSGVEHRNHGSGAPSKSASEQGRLVCRRSGETLTAAASWRVLPSGGAVNESHLQIAATACRQTLSIALIGLKSVGLVLIVIPGNNIGSSRSLRLAACFITFSRVKSSPHCFKT
jgi:hypothetical protein